MSKTTESSRCRGDRDHIYYQQGHDTHLFEQKPCRQWAHLKHCVRHKFEVTVAHLVSSHHKHDAWEYGQCERAGQTEKSTEFDDATAAASQRPHQLYQGGAPNHTQQLRHQLRHQHLQNHFDPAASAASCQRWQRLQLADDRSVVLQFEQPDESVSDTADRQRLPAAHVLYIERQSWHKQFLYKPV